ncbi:MAG: D-glycerate dehydrogenase [Thermoproteota archaeon]|nr:D-glycerate dehydrogenase [Thermoproteota archaeon]
MSVHKGNPRVMVTSTLHEDALKKLREVADVKTDLPRQLALSKPELLKIIGEYTGAIIGPSEPFDKDLIAAGKQLKVISRFGVGYDNVDVRAAVERGIYVTVTPVLSETVADLTFALILATSRKIPQAYNYMRDKKWGIERQPYIGMDVTGKTLGIMGLGRIGSMVAKRAKGFDMAVLYYDVIRNKKAEEELGLKYVSMDGLLSEADIITIHTPLTAKTTALIGEGELKRMKKTAILINTSRGPVIDEKAVYKALKEGWIAGAGLDVFEKEPTDPNNPILSLDNVVYTPHIASSTVECRYRMSMVSADNTIRVLKGEKPLYYVTS